MSVADTAINSPITANQATTTNTKSSTKLAKDLDSFLTLLTSQLKNQDPLSPMDSTEFTNQLTQFAQVEQEIHSNENLASLIGLTQQSIVSNAVNYIGKTVEGVSSQVPLQGGNLKASYSLASDAKTASVVIRDADGKIVHTENGETSKGAHEVKWNGKDGNGIQLPDGVYTMSISAMAADGTQIDAGTTAFGKVTGVTQVNGKTVVLLGSSTNSSAGAVGIPLDEILGVTS